MKILNKQDMENLLQNQLKLKDYKKISKLLLN